jgi:hypothetical protein
MVGVSIIQIINKIKMFNFREGNRVFRKFKMEEIIFNNNNRILLSSLNFSKIKIIRII